MLPSLKRYLPQALYEPLERLPGERHLAQARDHLAALLRTTKTYLPWPVVVAPQPAGVPAGGMYRGVFIFGDVSGFTPLSERLKSLGQAGAEQITAIINGLFTELVRVLFDHGGILLKFGGDALLGLFAAETDEEMAAGALRAVQAAAAMQEVMSQERFAAIEAAGETRALKIKCGVSAGPYFAAHIGTRQSMAYVTTGHTVNRAEQAEGHANPGEVALTGEVYELLAGSQVETGPVNKEPEKGFYLLLEAPPLEGVVGRHEIQEPPAGEVGAQIAYLVERLDRLSPYLSPELIARIVTNPADAKISPDHRPVTVMFANYAGISDLIQDLGQAQPQLVVEQLNRYFVHMAEIVEKYEGTVARMDQYAVGDRLVIFFGAPRAHEDDPVRAVHTALEMQRATRDHFSALQTATGVYRFQQRIGANTGHLFAGNAGAPDLRQEYTLMGDDINMAARLMSNAGWGEILISDKTQARVKDLFELSEPFELKVKGKAILIEACKVLRRLDQAGQRQVLERVEAPLIDRLEALGTVQKCGYGLLGGHGQIVSVISDSGLGKTRLTREFRSWLLKQEGAQDLLWVQCRALSFGQQTSYWLAGEMLRAALAVKPDTTKDQLLFDLWQRGGEWMGREAASEAVPFLAHLLGLELEGEWASRVAELIPQVRQKQTFWAAREFLKAMVRRQPAVLVLDDLHWADDASLDLLETLLELTLQVPLMFWFAFRPVRDKGSWRLRDKAGKAFRHRYTQVELGPLTEAESLDLLGKLLPGAAFPSETLAQIGDKAAGNPFYLEEVVRSLKMAGAVVRAEDETEQFLSKYKKFRKKVEERWRVTDEIAQIVVPDTLQSAIVARIDRLTEDARQVLQMAAVLGRQFQMDVLRTLTQFDADSGPWLMQLEQSDLIHPTDQSFLSSYAFSDALVHEVAYENMLVQRRQEFHRRVGESLEKILGERVEQECEKLALHFHASGDRHKAVKYLEMAGKKARDEYALKTSIQHYANLLEVETELGNQAGQAGALYAMGVMAYELGDYAQARPWLERAASLRQALADSENEAWSVMYLGMVELKQGNYDAAAAYHQSALALAQGRQDTFQEGIHLTNLARVTMRMGQYDLALDRFEKSLAMKRQVKDLTGQGFALFYQGLIHVYRRQYERAEAAFQAAIELWRQVPGSERVVSYYHYGVGLLALEQGQFERAEQNLQRALELGAKLVLKAETIENLSALGQARLGLERLDEARELSERAVKLLEEQKDVEERQLIDYNHYRVLAALHDPAASDSLRQAHDTMLERAGRIADEEARRIYIEQVKVNRDIQAAIQDKP